MLNLYRQQKDYFAWDSCVNFFKDLFMETKYNDATPQRPGERIIDDSLVLIEIPDFMKRLKEESTWNESDRNAITLFKTGGLTIVLIGLHKGAEMPRHTVADGIIHIQVLEGNILFTGDDRSLNVSAGQMLAIHKNMPHSVKAEADSFFLLTLAAVAEDEAGEDDGAVGSDMGNL
jgi:quercetin dioxygenase-like cupin family protein